MMAIPHGILDAIGNTPLVRLEHIGRDLPVPILVKCEHLNPGGSIKDRIALAIVDDAEQRGVLRCGMTLVEATAGNTGVGLALVAAARGYRLVCVMSEKMSADKRASLRSMGARVVVTPNGRYSLWAALRRVRGWFGSDTWRAAHFWSRAKLRRQVTGAGLRVVAARGAIHYPPTASAAHVLAPIDPWLSSARAPGAAFLVVSADKPTEVS